MIHCKYCNAEQNDGAIFCRVCGRTLIDIPQDDEIHIEPWEKGDAKGCSATIGFIFLLYLIWKVILCVI